MAGQNLTITGDNLPRDSGSRYMVGLYDPVNNNFQPLYANPVVTAETAAGLAIGHLQTVINSVMTATGAVSSAVNLGGYTVRALYLPIMGSGCNITFQASASGGGGWATIANNIGVYYSATGNNVGFLLGVGAEMNAISPMKTIRLSASQPQTADRTFTWFVST